jgi:hypothetical protein
MDVETEGEAAEAVAVLAVQVECLTLDAQRAVIAHVVRAICATTVTSTGEFLHGQCFAKRRNKSGLLHLL